MAAVMICFAVLMAITDPVSAIPTDYKKSSYSAVVDASGIHTVFPSDYWSQLDDLAKKYPNWRFQALYTGLKWADCFSGEYYSNDKGNSELYPERNLVQQNVAKEAWYYAPTSWFSTSIKGAYNWAKDEWTVVETPSFIQASEEAIKYCMDVRNWIGSEEQIFQFEDQTNRTASHIDLTNVEQLFANCSYASFWNQSADTTGIVDEKGNKYTYAEAITEISHRLGLNPLSVATRILQEQGSGTSGLMNGKQAFEVTSGADKGKKLDGGYYNYFNMGATGQSVTERYNNGLTESYYAGWNTRWKALVGGTEKLKSNYTGRKQTTIYLQKFNVISDSKYCLWGQYMTAIVTPQSEAKNIYRSYKDNGDLANKHVFVIPVFLDMPNTVAARPTKDGNPNYKLGSIYVDGKSVEKFDTDTLEYSLILPSDKTQVRLNISAYSKKSTITVNKQEGKDGALALDIPVQAGDSTVDILCTAENGDKRTYTLKLHREATLKYGDLNGDGGYNSVDLAMITSHLLKKTTLSGQALQAADINGDGQITSVDLAYITAFLLRKISSIPQR